MQIDLLPFRDMDLALDGGAVDVCTLLDKLILRKRNERRRNTLVRSGFFRFKKEKVPHDYRVRKSAHEVTPLPAYSFHMLVQSEAEAGEAFTARTMVLCFC